MGLMIGLSVGRNHPSSIAMEREFAEIHNLVNELESTYKATIREQDICIEVRDSIISNLKREMAKGEPYNIPIKVNVNIKE